MAHAYIPGLKILKETEFRKTRILPLKGKVIVKRGDQIDAKQVVARTELPGNVYVLKIANRLGIDPKQTRSVMLCKEGEEIKKGDLIAETKGLFGMFKSRMEVPLSGTVESVSENTGQVTIREAPVPVEIEAYISGQVDKLFPEEGIELMTQAALIQGIFGIAGEKHGEIAVVSKSREDRLHASELGPEMKGKIIVAGSFLDLEAYRKAMDYGVSAVVTGGFDYDDLSKVLGYDLGVAITGTENLSTALIVTEGYGEIPMGKPAFKLLKRHEGKFASVNGATQIRAGVIRPEVVIPLDSPHQKPDQNNPFQGGIERGSFIRIIRSPHFGRTGKIIDLPPELRKMESETLVRVAEVESDGRRLVVPRSNLEMIEVA